MPTFLFPLLLFLIRIAYAAPCISIDPSGPFVVSLFNNEASLTLNVSTCSDTSLSVSARPSELSPSFTTQPFPAESDSCSSLLTTLVFQSYVGSGKLVFTTPSCSISAPIVVAGLEPYHLPSRELVTAVGADPISIPAPQTKPVTTSFAVQAILPTGEDLRKRKAASFLEVDLSPSAPSIKATVGGSERSSHLQILSTDDGLDSPRSELVQTVTIRLKDENITSSFRVVHAPLSTVILTVNAPSRLSPVGGDRIDIVVRRAIADERRLVIGNVTVPETEFERSGANFVSSFLSPSLLPGRQEWRMELIVGSNVSVAEDISGHIFKVAAEPVLASLSPEMVRQDADGFIILSGSFEESVTVFINGKATSARDIVYRASGEIIMRLPSLGQDFSGTASVWLKTKKGKRSNKRTLTVDSKALHVDAVIPHASTDESTGHLQIPVLCNHTDPPVVFARADTPADIYDAPNFTFLIRKSKTEMNFEELTDGPSGMIPLDPALFGEDASLEGDFVIIRVLVSQRNDTGEAIILVNRRLRSDVIGVTILSPLEAQRGTGHDVLEAQVSRLRGCRNITNFETETSWSINRRTIISTGPDDKDGFEKGTSAVAVAFGRTVIIPNHRSFSYFATVAVQDRSTGKRIASGSSRRRGRLRALDYSLRTFLNGGMRSITLKSGMETFEIHSSVYDVDDEISSSKVQYSWDCAVLTTKGSECPEALFPLEVRENLETSKFNLTTNEVKNGLTVEYTLTASTEAGRMGSSRLRLSVNEAESAIFPESEIFAPTSLPDVLLDGSIQFSCYQHIILTTHTPRANDSYNFALFSTESGSDLLEASADEILIAHSGYWSPRNRGATQFGIIAQKLGPGNYTLQGARDGDITPNRGASWTFQIARCPILVPYSLPVLTGEAGVTTFFAGASSVPPSKNLFFFELMEETDEDQSTSPDEKSAANVTAYLPECSGAQLCSFSVPTEGRYYIRIVMYDPTGTRILSSERIDSKLAINAPTTKENKGDSSSPGSAGHQDAIESALRQKDEGSFIRSVLQAPQGEVLETRLLDESILGLQNLASSPTLVPVRAARILGSCSRLLLYEQSQGDFERLGRIIRAVETAITGSVSNAGPATALRGPAINFYSTLLQEPSNSQPNEDSPSSTDGFGALVQRSAASHIPLILAVGRECGFSDQLVVKFPSQTRVNVSSGTPLVSKSDDYRVAINCFRGQVDRLLPEPVSTERCSESDERSRTFASPQILTSVEQNELTEEAVETEKLDGPTMRARITKLQSANNSIVLVEENQSNSECYRTRVSVYVSMDLAEELLSSQRENTDISCSQDVLPVTSLDVEGVEKSDLKSDVKEFTVGSDGTVSTSLEAPLPFSARMVVNGTRLRECIAATRLEGNGSSPRTVILSVVGSLVAVLLIVILLLVWRRYLRRERFSVPASLAPWDSFGTSQSRTRSTLSSYYQSGELEYARNEWENEYGHVQHHNPISSPQQTHIGSPEVRDLPERRRVRGVPGSAMEEWGSFNGSRVSSMLTATDSYTTSSGDLSGYELSNRARLQAGLTNLPGLYVAEAFRKRDSRP